MKLKAFAQRIVNLLERHADDEVVIETRDGGIPHRTLVAVKAVAAGFDWTAGKILLISVDPLVKAKTLDKPIRELARERLDRLKQQHAYLFPDGKYIAKAREHEWIEGFGAGVRELVTSVREQTIDDAVRCPEVQRLLDLVHHAQGTFWRDFPEAEVESAMRPLLDALKKLRAGSAVP